MFLEKMQPAAKGEVMIYMPYYPQNKHGFLPYAITLYHQASLEGKRIIEGGEGIPFIATWSRAKLPSEMTRCRLQFDNNADYSYEVSLTNSEFIEYLIEVIRSNKLSGSVDFPQPFYRKLLSLAS
jgi:hypothetical protein